MSDLALSMRPVVADLLADLGDAYPDLVVLAADSRGLALTFRRRHPRRFIDVGIAEANLAGVAAGLARDGFRVVIGTMAPFLIRRAAEQLRLDICQPGLNVTLLGVGGGLAYGSLGPTHHITEDLAAVAAMPGTRVYCPADVHDAAWAVRAAISGSGPSYVRLGAREDAVVYGPGDEFSADRPRIFGTGGPLVVATGATVAPALEAAELAERDGVPVRVLALTQVSPFPREALRRAADGSSTVVTVEDHLAQGGLAGLVASSLTGRWQGRLVTLAVDGRPAPAMDRAGLHHFYGIDAPAIVRALTDPDLAKEDF